MMFNIKFEAKDVDNLVKAYWPVQSERMQGIEHDLENRSSRVRAAQKLTKDDFTLACSWIAVRAKSRYESNTEDIVRKMTSRAFSAPSHKSCGYFFPPSLRLRGRGVGGEGYPQELRDRAL